MLATRITRRSQGNQIAPHAMQHRSLSVALQRVPATGMEPPAQGPAIAAAADPTVAAASAQAVPPSPLDIILVKPLTPVRKRPTREVSRHPQHACSVCAADEHCSCPKRSHYSVSLQEPQPLLSHSNTRSPVPAGSCRLRYQLTLAAKCAGPSAAGARVEPPAACIAEPPATCVACACGAAGGSAGACRARGGVHPGAGAHRASHACRGGCVLRSGFQLSPMPTCFMS